MLTRRKGGSHERNCVRFTDVSDVSDQCAAKCTNGITDTAGCTSAIATAGAFGDVYGHVAQSPGETPSASPQERVSPAAVGRRYVDPERDLGAQRKRDGRRWPCGHV